MMKRRNLSGIYIFDKFPEDERRQPTCVEDCQPETRQKWLESLEKEALINLANQLCETLVHVADFAGVTASEENA